MVLSTSHPPDLFEGVPVEGYAMFDQSKTSRLVPVTNQRLPWVTLRKSVNPFRSGAMYTGVTIWRKTLTKNAMGGQIQANYGTITTERLLDVRCVLCYPHLLLEEDSRMDEPNWDY